MKSYIVLVNNWTIPEFVMGVYEPLGKILSAFLRSCLALWGFILVLLAGFSGIGLLISGDTIAYESNRSGNYEIYVMDTRSKTSINLTNNFSQDRNPTWSPDGRYIAFESVRHVPGYGVRTSVFLMDMHNRQQANRILPGFLRAMQPSWSPGGNFLAFSGATNSMVNNDIFVVNAHNGAILRITNSRDLFEYNPGWSPNGDQLVYGVYNPTVIVPSDVYVVDFEQNDLRLVAQFISDPVLVSDEHGAADPTFTPDGNVMFVYNVTAERIHITGTRADDEDIPLSIPYIRLIEEPVMSADGNWIAFTSSINQTQLWRSIYRIRTDGSGLERLTSGTELINARDGSAAWKPKP